MWDKDIVKSNDMIGEHQIYLNNDTFPMFSK